MTIKDSTNFIIKENLKICNIKSKDCYEDVAVSYVSLNNKLMTRNNTRFIRYNIK